MTCEPCRQQLLPFLYDLLDPLERQAVSAHVEICADCQAALAAAREQQGMLAEAVKQEHADIVFKAPIKATPSSTAPTVVMQRPSRRRAWINRWSVAAGILLVLFTAAGAVGWSAWSRQASEFQSANTRLAKAKDALAQSHDEFNQKKGQTQKEIRAIQEQIDALYTKWRQEETKTRTVLEEQGAQIILKGPQSPVAGANNPYEIQVRQENFANFNQQQQGAGNKENKKGDQGQLPGVPPMQQMQFRIVNDKTKQPLLQRDLKLQGLNNTANFDIPANTPFKPGENYSLEFETQTADGKWVTLSDRLKLDFPEYVTHLATDRPLYRPGDVVRFRSLTLERFHLKPPEQKFHLRYRIVGPNQAEIYNKEFASSIVTGPNGEPIKGPDGAALHGLGVGEFTLPADLADGPYTLSVSEVNDRFNEEKRTFTVRRTQTARYFKEVQFDRSAYKAGERVRVRVRAVPMQGIRQAILVDAHLTIDGQALSTQSVATDKDGRAEFDFTLPNPIKGIGTLTVVFDRGGAEDRLVRAVPLIVPGLQVEFYPEGGDLVAGAANRVYFQARTPANRPAEMIGRIVDDKDIEVVRVQTVSDAAEPAVNRGLGSFLFTPTAGKKYRLRIDAPIGVDRTFALPDVNPHGVVLHVPVGVVEREIDVRLNSVGKSRVLLVGAYCRGRMLDHKVVKAIANQPTRVTLKPTADVGGVHRITVFEQTGPAHDPEFRPLAERLIYRKTAARLDVAIQADRPSYHPGDTVRLNLQARNEQKAPAPAIALVAVADGRVLDLADEKTVRILPTHFLLTTEVRNPEELEHADFLLSDHPKAAYALDLLLGSQGWRRFAEQNPQVFQRKQQVQTNQRNITANSIVVTQFLDNEQKQIEKLDQTFVKQAIEMEQKLADAENQEPTPADEQRATAGKQVEVQLARQETVRYERSLREIRAFFIQFTLGGALLIMLFVAFYFVSIGLRRLSGGEGSARRWLGAGIGLVAILFLVSILGTFAFMGERLIDDKGDRDLGREMAIGLKMPPPQDAPGNAAPVVPGPEAPLDEDVVLDPQQKRKAGDVADKLKDNAAGPAAMQFRKDQVDAVMFGQDLDQRNERKQAPANDIPEERLLRQQGNYQAILLNKLGRRVPLPAVNDPCVVREYAHQHKRAADGQRDGAEILCWHPVVVMPDGKAELAFDLADTVTRYQVLVQTHGLDGRLGANRIDIAAKLPLTLAPEIPPEIGARDSLTIPVTLRNEPAIDKTRSTLAVRVNDLQVLNDEDRDIVLVKDQATREYFKVQPTIDEGTAFARFVSKFGRSQTAVAGRIKVVPDGYPVAESIGGVIDTGSVTHEVTLPERWIPGSLRMQVHFYASPLAELQGALDDLQREPAMTFEQLLARQTLQVMMLQHMKRNPAQANSVLESRIRKAIQAGQPGLDAFGCFAPADKNNTLGFDWFAGSTTPHDALTALAFQRFRELAEIHPVDPNLLRALETSLGKRFDSLRDPIMQAFVLSVLAGSSDELDRQAAALREQCKTSNDPYFVALVAQAHVNRKKMPEAAALLKQLREFQKTDGKIAGARTSITGSQGRDLDVEITALAALAWLKSARPGDYGDNLDAAVRWLHQQRRGAGSFGGTQATTLALQALLEHDRRRPRAFHPGDVAISVLSPANGDGASLANDLAILPSRAHDPFTLTLTQVNVLRPGKNAIHLTVPNNTNLPYTLTWSYRTDKPTNDPKAPIKLTTKLNKDRAREGDTVKLTAVVENMSGRAQGITAAVIGLPAGLVLPDSPRFNAAAWELRGRELVLAWRDLPAGARIQIDVDLLCKYPGMFRGPASRAYRGYADDRKYWVEPMNMRIEELP